MTMVWQSQACFPQGGQLDFHHSHGIFVLSVLNIGLDFRVRLPYTWSLTDSPWWTTDYDSLCNIF
jgi:hypothetical protein